MTFMNQLDSIKRTTYYNSITDFHPEYIKRYTRLRRKFINENKE